MNKVNVGLIGFGTVGAGVAKAILQRGRWLKRHVGARVVLRRVCDKEFRRSRGFRLPPGLTTTYPAKILRDPEIHILVELIGGHEPAKTFILEALNRGKHVVTANKALLAHSGREIFAAAARHNVDMYFEA